VRSWKFATGLFAAIGLLLGGCEGHNPLQETSSNDLLPPLQSSKDGARSAPIRPAGANQNSLLAGVRKNDLTPVSETVAHGTGEFMNPAAGSGELYNPATTSAGQDGITLNLVNTPIPQAAKTVLGDIMGLNYTVADKVTGTITLQTSAPIPRAGLVDAFEVALKASGFSITSSQGFYRVVPSNALSQLGAPVTRKRPADAPGVQFQIIPIRHIAAAEMKRVLEPIVAQGAVTRVDETRNILVVSGTNSELANINNLVGIFDVDYMKGMSFALYPVKSSDPEGIVAELDTIFGADKDGPLKGVVRFIPNRRLGSVLVISSRPDQLAKAKLWIEKLDKAAQQGEQQLFVYKIQNRQAAELASLLQRVLTLGEKRQGGDAQSAVAPRFDAATLSSPAVDDTRPQPSTGAASGSVGSSGSLASSAFGANSTTRTSPAGAAGEGRGISFEAGGTKVVADEQDNALVIQATPKEYQRIVSILQRLDRQPTQVMLEAVIAEITLNDELKFGVKWYAQKNPSQFTFSDAAAGAVASTFPGFSYFFSTTNIKVALDALSSVTKVNVVSAPSLMVMDNRKATLQIGDQVPIITQTAQGVAVTGAPVVNSVTLKDTGVILSVTPRVNDSGRVVLDVEQEVSNVTKTTSSGIDSPTIQQRRIRTTITVKDGEVLALGGLIQQRDGTTKTQVPILGNLPVVGAAFRTKDDTIDRTELVIFLRPQVVRDDTEAAGVTEEFRSRIALDPLKPTRGNRQYGRDLDRIVR
jgi:general secretion pathway protein D